MNRLTRSFGAAAVLAMLACCPCALAEDEPDGEGLSRIEEVVVLGSRRPARSTVDTPAPVDTLAEGELVDQATSDISDMLRMVVPSYNVNTQPISDGGTVVRPANLRGLSPDQTLVLLNGKRRHRAAVITFLGGGISDGAHGPDVGVFPALGLKQVEVLRDGAASQYGSDAIAGVMNFVLRDDRQGTTFEAKAGATYTGDGENHLLAANVGLPLGATGFVNLSAEYGETGDTIRSVQRADATELLAAGFAAVKDIRVNGITTEVTQIWGQPRIDDAVKVFVNSGYDFESGVEAYAFGNYAKRTVEGGFFFRHPTGRDNRRIYDGPKVNPANGNAVVEDDAGTARDAVTGELVPRPVASVRVGDLSPEASGDCPTGIPVTHAGGLVPDPAILRAVVADDNCFAFLELFPGGFVPRFGGHSIDRSLVGGVRGTLPIGSGLGFDISYAYGYNKIDYFIKNTVNPSLGPNTPTAFKPGAYEQIDSNVNIDVTYEIPARALASALHAAAGVEWRREQFDITAGDLPSRQRGPLTVPSTAYPRGQGFASSSNGFGGFTASSSNNEDSVAVYAEVEADVRPSVSVQTAIRWEHFSSFGATFNYKLGGVWRAGEQLALRSTFSTGFRAPTAGQANVTNVSTAFIGDVIKEQATLPLSSAAGQFVNSELGNIFSLDAERARNFSFGAAFALGAADVTVDFFDIVVEDRIAISEQQDFRGLLVRAGERSGLSLADMGISQDANGDGMVNADDGESAQILNALDAAGVVRGADFAGAEDLASVAFFNNDFDTETRGVDLVASMPLAWVSGDTTLALALNYTDTRVTRPGDLGATRLRQLEENLPTWKGNIAVTHNRPKTRWLARLNFHGPYGEAHADDGSRWIEPGAEVTLDVEGTYAVNDQWEVVGGVANLFDNFPDEHQYATVVGSRYPTTAPFGLSGGQYYVKVRFLR